MSQGSFLAKLHQEANLQAKLHQTRLAPTQLNGLLSLIGHYPWQSLMLASLLAAVVMRLLVL